MTCLVRIRVTAALLGLLLCVAGGSEAQGNGPHRFKFSTQLKNPKAIGKTRTVQRGTILMPVLRSSEDLYQPVILCIDLKDIKFDAQGLSKTVHIEGFCRGAGLPPEEGLADKFEWTVTKSFAPEIRLNGCVQEIIDEIKDRQTKLGGPYGEGPAPWRRTCNKPSAEECLDFFDDATRRDKNLGTDHQTLIDKRVCHRSINLDKERRWKGASLECWPQLLRDRKADDL